MKRTSLFVRRGPAGIVLAAAGLAAVLAIGGERRPAWASDPPKEAPPGASSRPPIERIDESTALPKPAYTGPTPTGKVPACALEAYAKLDEEKKSLAATYGVDSPTFQAAYRARKHALVGEAAMEARGCKGGPP